MRIIGTLVQIAVFGFGLAWMIYGFWKRQCRYVVEGALLLFFTLLSTAFLWNVR
jgi:hypothetical protein